MRLPLLSRLRGRQRSQGQSLVELALIAPVMLLLLLTAIDLGRLMYSQITVTNAAREGALVASQGGTFVANATCSDANTIMCGVLTEAQDGFVEIDRTRVSVDTPLCDKNAMYPTSGSPPNVEVTVSAPFKVLAPIIGDIVGTNLVLAATAEAQCLVVPRVTYPDVPDPVAAFTASPTSGPAPLTVSFDASASSSTGATITSYSWSFGASGPTASRLYSSPGTYQVTLTVTDSRGGTDTESVTITVGSVVVTCPTVDFTATDRSNAGNPHRMNLAATLTPNSTGWTWQWFGDWQTGAIGSSQNLNNFNFPGSGDFEVTVTATKATCVVTTTKTVTAP